MTDDWRSVEDHLSLQTISAEASREKSVRKGYVSTAAPVVGAAAARGVPGGRKLENGVTEPLR